VGGGGEGRLGLALNSPGVRKELKFKLERGFVPLPLPPAQARAVMPGPSPGCNGRTEFRPPRSTARSLL
jgi:hypothetical protein